ncbi:hypothetical protein [Actinomadura livida]|uniref:SAVED domain-containing protein n=1 Tax=Actinomadura livida TaxID=79909 RepID=A0A7W7I7B5_9ACTN|nr:MULTISPECIES: hypothetical protein [Actinomadura]MBB4771857.1 hypothetical protein [Actinomadura catellatispora]GGU02913.1 hypothetical protein GCM10010208_28800 [Actinomadura livida]
MHIARWLRRTFATGPGLATIIGAAGAGLALGTLPNLLEKFAGYMKWPPTSVLAAGAVIGVLALALAHLALHRRDGVGIVLFVPPAPRLNWSRERLEAMKGHAKQRHHAAFTVDVEEVFPDAKAGRERRELARRIVQARLNEDAPHGVVSAPVTFYAVVSLPDAYQLGRELKFQVHERVEAHASDAPTIRQGSVAQTSEEAGKTIFTAVRVDSRLRKPLSRRHARRVRRLLSFEELPGGTAAGSAHRAALVLELTPNTAMVTDPCAVASTGLVRHEDGTHRGYVMDEKDPWLDGTACGSLLVVRCPAGALPDERTDYEVAVTEISQRWLALLEEVSQREGRAAEGVLFCSAPASVAFGLGAVIGRRTRIITFRNDLPGRTRPVSAADNRSQ